MFVFFIIIMISTPLPPHLVVLNIYPFNAWDKDKLLSKTLVSSLESQISSWKPNLTCSRRYTINKIVWYFSKKVCTLGPLERWKMIKLVCILFYPLNCVLWRRFDQKTIRKKCIILAKYLEYKKCLQNSIIKLCFRSH